LKENKPKKSHKIHLQGWAEQIRYKKEYYFKKLSIAQRNINYLNIKSLNQLYVLKTGCQDKVNA